MSRAIYLHVGMPKTGTTALQHFFKINQQELANQGIVYPVSGRLQHNHHELSLLGSTDDSNARLAWQEAKRHYESSNKNLLISSERLAEQFYSGNYLNLVSQIIPGARFKIIIYLRRQDDFIDSAYKFFTQAGSYISDIKRLSETMILDYQPILHHMEAAVGIENLTVKLYTKRAFKKSEDLIADFLRLVGVDDTKRFTVRKHPVNKSLPAGLVPVVRRMNGVSHDHFLKRRAVNAVFVQLFHASGCRLATDKKLSVLSDDASRSVLEKYEESNLAVFDRYIENESASDFLALEHKEGIDLDALYFDPMQVVESISQHLTEHIPTIIEEQFPDGCTIKSAECPERNRKVLRELYYFFFRSTHIPAEKWSDTGVLQNSALLRDESNRLTWKRRIKARIERARQRALTALSAEKNTDEAAIIYNFIETVSFDSVIKEWSSALA